MADTNRPENELKNSIDVQLNLFKQNEVDELRKLFNQFKTSVDALQVLGTVADRAAAGQKNSQHHTGTTSSQSTAGESATKAQSVGDQRAENERNQNFFKNIKERTQKTAYNYVYKGEHGERAISNLLLRGELKNWRFKDYAGLGAYALGRAYYNQDGTTRGGTAGTAMGLGAGLLALEATGNGPLSRLYSAVNLQGPTTYGTNAGQAGMGTIGGWSGPFGMFGRLASPAFRSYLGSQWNAVENAAAGFPFYSFGQATQAQGIINQLGYASSDGIRAQMAQVFRNVSTQIPAITQAQTGQMLDMGYRYGASSIYEMQQQLMSIPQAAQAAQMGVQQFTDQLIQTAASVSQTTGAPASAVTAQLSSISSAAGVSPAVAGGIMSNDLLTNITAAKGGGNFWAAVTSPFAGGKRLDLIQSFIEQGTGMSMQHLQHLQKYNKRAYDNAMNNVYLMWKADPSLFGNMTPGMINGLIGRGGTHGSFATATQAIRIAQSTQTKNSGVYSIATIMRDLGMTHQQQVKFLQDNQNASYKDKIDALSKEAAKREHQMNRRMHSPQVQVGLTPDARKLLRIIPNDAPHTRNQNQNLSDLAVTDTGSGVAYGAH